MGQAPRSIWMIATPGYLTEGLRLATSLLAHNSTMVPQKMVMASLMAPAQPLVSTQLDE
jgi:hypothetical protein